MKMLLAVFAILATLTLGCSQSDQEQQGSDATPTPTDKITDMDFESGEIEQTPAVGEEEDEGSEPEGD
jgi:PBP1b-binding outer membrane lipoprotein LpoB